VPHKPSWCSIKVIVPGARYCKHVRAIGMAVMLWLLFSATLLTSGKLFAEKKAADFVEESMLEQLHTTYGNAAKRRGLLLNRLITTLRNADVATQLREVNRFFNQFPYASDKALWGTEDYWQTPWEFLGRNGGDCEDYVISKYFVLRELGIADSKLYLTYVKAIRKNIAHMVLSYFETPETVPVVLDNYNPRILPATERNDLIPVYSFNAESLFVAKSAGLGQALPADKYRNSHWERLLKNLKRNQL
jgi:predicted transglutaminase-like cysteine proteinase